MLRHRGSALCGMVLFVAAPLLCAQQEAAVGSANAALTALENVSVPPDRAKPPLHPAQAVPTYPLQVTLLSGHTTYQGNHFYKGGGVFLLDGASRPFKYACPDAITFAGATYPMRWKKADTKLDILLQKARGHGSTTCTLTVAQR